MGIDEGERQEGGGDEGPCPPVWHATGWMLVGALFGLSVAALQCEFLVYFRDDSDELRKGFYSIVRVRQQELDVSLFHGLFPSQLSVGLSLVAFLLGAGLLYLSMRGTRTGFIRRRYLAVVGIFLVYWLFYIPLGVPGGAVIVAFHGFYLISGFTLLVFVALQYRIRSSRWRPKPLPRRRLLLWLFQFGTVVAVVVASLWWKNRLWEADVRTIPFGGVEMNTLRIPIVEYTLSDTIGKVVSGAAVGLASWLLSYPHGLRRRYVSYAVIGGLCAAYAFLPLSLFLPAGKEDGIQNLPGIQIGGSSVRKAIVISSKGVNAHGVDLSGWNSLNETASLAEYLYKAWLDREAPVIAPTRANAAALERALRELPVSHPLRALVREHAASLSFRWFDKERYLELRLASLEDGIDASDIPFLQALSSAAPTPRVMAVARALLDPSRFQRAADPRSLFLLGEFFRRAGDVATYRKLIGEARKSCRSKPPKPNKDGYDLCFDKMAAWRPRRPDRVGEVSGKITLDGKGVASVALGLVSEECNHRIKADPMSLFRLHHCLTADSRTDSNGHFRFRSVPRDSYQLLVWIEDLGVSAERIETKPLAIRVDSEPVETKISVELATVPDGSKAAWALPQAGKKTKEKDIQPPDELSLKSAQQIEPSKDPKKEYEQMVAALPAGELSLENHRPRALSPQVEKRGYALWKLADKLPKIGLARKWSIEDRSSKEVWERVTFHLSKHRKTLRKALELISEPVSRVHLDCQDEGQESDPYERIRALSGFLMWEHEYLLRQGDREKALQLWLAARPMTRFLDGNVCHNAVRADDNVHYHSLRQLERQLDGTLPDSDDLSRIREELEKRNNLGDDEFVREVRYLRADDDSGFRVLDDSIESKYQRLIDSLRYYARVLEILNGPPAQRLDRLRFVGPWKLGLPSARSKKHQTPPQHVYWEYEVHVEIRTLRVFALCAIDMIEAYLRDGAFPSDRGQECKIDERGKPFVFEQTETGFAYRLAGGYDWPERIGWKYDLPRNGQRLDKEDAQHPREFP